MRSTTRAIRSPSAARRVLAGALQGLVLIAAAGCAAHQAPVREAAPTTAAARAAEEPAWRYEVVAGAGAVELSVDATFAAGAPSELSVDDGAEPFVRDVEIEGEGPFRPLERQGTSWIAPSCTTRGCRVRYRFLLAEAARTLDNVELALNRGGAFVAPPSTWLLHPLLARAGAKFRFHVTTPAGISFATGVFPVKNAAIADSWEADVSDLPETPYSAFGPLRRARLSVGGAILEIAICPGTLGVPDDFLLEWIGTSARAVTGYFGRFPIPRALVLVLPTEGSGFGYAKALGNGGGSIAIPVGSETPKAEFTDDWVLTHEMVHLGFPTVPRRHAWIEEGIATYVEPIARARAGIISPEEVWKGLLWGIPHGLPEAGDRGLDNTRTWGRLYWGGALFCLMADLEIRQKFQNRRSLDDALRGILGAGGTAAVRWNLELALREGDSALGVPLLRDLHAQWGPSPVMVDLPRLWRELGVAVQQGRVIFDDHAPLAAIRASITARPSSIAPSTL